MKTLLWLTALLCYIVVMAFAFAAFDFFTLDAGWGGYNWFGDYRFIFNDVISWLCPLGFALGENVFYLYAQWFHGWTGVWYNPVGDWTFDWGPPNFYPMWKWYLSFGVRQVVWCLVVWGIRAGWRMREPKERKEYARPRRIARTP